MLKAFRDSINNILQQLHSLKLNLNFINNIKKYLLLISKFMSKIHSNFRNWLFTIYFKFKTLFFLYKIL